MKNWTKSIKALFVCLCVLTATSCGKPSGLPDIGGVKGPFLNVVDGKIMLTVKLLNLNSPAGLKAPIPKTSKSAIEFSPNAEDGGMMIVLYLDPEDLKSIDIGSGDGNTLPDGRPLPGIPGGVLENSLRLDTPWYDLSFYFHKKLFGVWIPVGFETAGISGYWNMSFRGKNIGFLGVVGSDNSGHKAGGVILLRLDNLQNKQLQHLIELSKKNPGFVY